MLLGHWFLYETARLWKSLAFPEKSPNNFLPYLNNTRVPAERVIARRVSQPPRCSRLILTCHRQQEEPWDVSCGRITFTDEWYFTFWQPLAKLPQHRPPLEAPPSCVCAQSLSTVHFTRTSSGETTEHEVRFLGAGMSGPLVKVGFAITASSSSKPAVIAKAFYFLLVRNKMLLWQSQYLAELQFMVVLFVSKDFCIFDLTMQLVSQLDFLNPPQLVC